MPRKELNQEGAGNIFTPIPREENMVRMNPALQTETISRMKASTRYSARARGTAKTKKK